MKIFSILMLFPFLTFAKITIKNEMVQPFELVNYPIQKFVSDYAKTMKRSILVEKKILINKLQVNLSLNNEVSAKQFEELFYTILDSQKLTAIDDGSFIQIIEARDIRYTATEFYSSDDYPKSDNYVLVLHQLKHPVAGDITRNMRPFLSRYARIINFDDAHSIAINERGRNIEGILKLINSLDNKTSYKHIINKKKKRKNKSFKNSSDTNVENEILKLENELLKKKLLKIKTSSSKKRRS